MTGPLGRQIVGQYYLVLDGTNLCNAIKKGHTRAKTRICLAIHYVSST